jgi:MFS family permease
LIVAVYSFGLSLAICLLAVPIPVLAREQFGASDAQIGVLGTVGMLCYTVGAFIGGRLADRCSYRRLIVSACIAVALFAALYPLMPTFWLLVAANALMLLGLAFFWPTLMAWMSASTTMRALPGILMIFNLGWSVGQIGDYLGGEFYDLHPHAAFFLAAGCAAVFALVTLALPARIWRRRTADTTTAAISSEGQTAVSVHADHFLWLAWSSNCLSAVLVAGVRTLFPPMAVDLHYHTRIIGLLLMTMPAMQIGVFVLLGRWHGWHYRFWPLALAQVLAAAGCMIAVRASGPTGFAAGFVLMGLLFGVTYTSSLFYSVHGQADTGRRAGMHEGITGMGAIAGPVLFGTISHYTDARMPYHVNALLLLILTAAQALLLLAWHKRMKELRAIPVDLKTQGS